MPLQRPWNNLKHTHPFESAWACRLWREGAFLSPDVLHALADSNGCVCLVLLSSKPIILIILPVSLEFLIVPYSIMAPLFHYASSGDFTNQEKSLANVTEPSEAFKLKLEIFTGLQDIPNKSLRTPSNIFPLLSFVARSNFANKLFLTQLIWN